MKPGQLEALRALSMEMVESTKSQAGALIYERFLSEDQQIVHVFERYIDSAAADGKRLALRIHHLVESSTEVPSRCIIRAARGPTSP